MPIKPFSIFTRIRLSAREIEVGDLLNLYDFSGPQKEFLRSARNRWGQDWFGRLMGMEPTELQAAFNNQFHEGTIGVIQRRLQYLSQFDLITSDPKVSITNSANESSLSRVITRSPYLRSARS